LKKLAIAGCGKLSQIVVQALNNGLLDEYSLCAVYSRTKESAEKLAAAADSSHTAESGCAVCSSIDELISHKPDYLVEAASPVLLREIAQKVLTAGTSIITLSMGAFADTDFFHETAETAKKYGTRVYLVSGAIGGFDALRTVSLMGGCTASIDTEKGPDSLKNTPVYEDALQNEKRTVFRGSAAEVIKLFPTKVNVAVAASLASTGPNNIAVSVTSTPGFVGDDHRVEIRNDQVTAIIDIYSKTSQIAGWSVVNTLRNIVSPIVF
jgi:aspartate dehydrogenase